MIDSGKITQLARYIAGDSAHITYSDYELHEAFLSALRTLTGELVSNWSSLLIKVKMLRVQEYEHCYGHPVPPPHPPASSPHEHACHAGPVIHPPHHHDHHFPQKIGKWPLPPDYYAMKRVQDPFGHDYRYEANLMVPFSYFVEDRFIKSATRCKELMLTYFFDPLVIPDQMKPEVCLVGLPDSATDALARMTAKMLSGAYTDAQSIAEDYAVSTKMRNVAPIPFPPMWGGSRLK